MPIEVAPFAYAKLLQNVRRLGSADANLRMAKGGKAGPVVTDNGNFVIDAPFDANQYSDPYGVCIYLSVSPFFFIVMNTSFPPLSHGVNCLFFFLSC